MKKTKEYLEAENNRLYAYSRSQEHEIEDLEDEVAKLLEENGTYAGMIRNMSWKILRKASRIDDATGELSTAELYQRADAAIDEAFDYWKRIVDKIYFLYEAKLGENRELSERDKMHKQKEQEQEDEIQKLKAGIKDSGQKSKALTAAILAPVRKSDDAGTDKSGSDGGKEGPEKEDRDTSVVTEAEEEGELLSGFSQAKLVSSTRSSYKAHARKESGRIYENEKRQKERKEAKESDRDGSILQVSESLGEVQKMVLATIGTEGFSKYPQIEGKVMEVCGCSKNTCRRAVSWLADRKLLKEVRLIGSPNIRKVVLCQMTESGRLAYEKICGRKPVESEMDALIREHGTCMHGYGIMETAIMLQNCGYIRKRKGHVVYMNGRKRIPVGEDGNGHSLYFVPDITISFPDGSVQYIEYETNNTSDEDFKRKCRKFSRAAERLYFVVPTRPDLEIILKRIEDWLEEYRNKENSSGRISVFAQAFKDLEYSLSSTDENGQKKESEPEWVRRGIKARKEALSTTTHPKVRGLRLPCSSLQ